MEIFFDDEINKIKKNLKVFLTLHTDVSFSKPEVFLNLLGDSNVHLVKWAKMIMEHLDFSSFDCKEVEIVKISVGELGFQHNANLKEIYVQAKKVGLEVCSSSIIPCLCLSGAFKTNDMAYVTISPVNNEYYLLGIWSEKHNIYVYGHQGSGVWDIHTTLIFQKIKTPA